MAKRKALEKKKRSTVRERNWELQQDTAFSHDLVRHRRALAKLPEHSPYTEGVPENCLPNATVVNHSRKWAFVKMDALPCEMEGGQASTCMCLIDERLQDNNETLMAPGDRVQMNLDGNDPVIVGVAPRKTRLMRLGGVHSRCERQVLAANVDLLVIVCATKNPAFSPGLVDRFLIAAQQGGVTPVVCFNKIDLAPLPDIFPDLYADLGIPVYRTSCKTGQGIQELKELLLGKTSVLAGHSGVGKSSLLNKIDPKLNLLTREISETTLKGRHATTAGVLYELHPDIRIIDTPGIRSLGLWDLSPEEVALYFPEMAEYGMQCKFRDCTHIHEKSCAVRDAVASGAIMRARYDSYRRIRAGITEKQPHQPS